MICPLCDYKLTRLSVRTDSGGSFTVEHCGQCGGTWFDPYEINRIPYREVLSLAERTVNPKKPSFIGKTQFCPTCHKELVTQESEAVPLGVEFLRCSNCGGIWATQRSLEKFKKHQEHLIARYKETGASIPPLSVVFIPTLAFILLFLSTFVTLLNLQKVNEGRTRAEAIISQVNITPITPQSVSITFRTRIAVVSKLHYGLSSLDASVSEVSTIPSTDHTIILSNLGKQTTYLFRITLTDEEGNSFTTFPQAFTTGE